jgi:hypothetical protein
MMEFRNSPPGDEYNFNLGKICAVSRVQGHYFLHNVRKYWLNV